MLDAALQNQTNVFSACAALDNDLMGRLTAAGGSNYAVISALAYRQSYASTIMAWNYEREEMWQVRTASLPARDIVPGLHSCECGDTCVVIVLTTVSMIHPCACAARAPQFLKEISSGSDMSTVDVIYPAAPLYLLGSPSLLWRLLVPLLEYANNETYIEYNLAWAPHRAFLSLWLCSCPVF
jgi:hypothetical protein